MTSVSITGLVRRFGEAVAVNGIDLTIRQGEFLTILGPSGCGKTTTLRMIAGLDRSDGGRIVLGDRVVDDPVSGIYVASERRSIGMVFQSYAIWPHMTAFENVAYPLLIRRRPRAEIRQRVMQSLRLVNLENYADRPAPALSGGQQQRVAIARAIVFEPTLLLMDEPLSNLDARLREVMRLELRALQQRLGITTVYVTHDQDEAMSLSDRIVVMEGGNVLQQAPPEAMYRRPATRAVARFLGAPNLFEVTIEDTGTDAEGQPYVDVERDGVRIRAHAAAGLRSGQTATLVIRPETIRLSRPSSNPGSPSWAGTITQDSFRGARRTYLVSHNADTLNVDADGNSAFRTGDQVAITLDMSNLWVVRHEHNHGGRM